MGGGRPRGRRLRAGDAGRRPGGRRRGARAALRPRDVELVEAPLDDAWMRDIGPTFVLGADGALGAVDWVFNGWGAQAWATWEQDARIGVVRRRRGPARRGSRHRLVNEGGGIHVDGLGHRAAHRDRAARPGPQPRADPRPTSRPSWRAPSARRRASGSPRGLTRDYDEFGTRGHVDIVATFAVARASCCCTGRATRRTPTTRSRSSCEGLLSAARDARGEPLEVVRVPAPKTLEDDEGPVDWSLHQPPRRQRRRRRLHLRRPAGRRLARRARAGVRRAPGRRRRRPPAVRPRRRHPLHHPAAAPQSDAGAAGRSAGDAVVTPSARAERGVHAGSRAVGSARPLPPVSVAGERLAPT